MDKILFRIARLKIMGTFVGYAFAYFPFLIPVKEIIKNKKAVSFKHPSATYPDHVLIIPRKILRTVFCLSGEDLTEIIGMAVKIRHGDSRDFVLLINGGRRQDVMQAHFHLFTGNLAVKKGFSKRIDMHLLLKDKCIDSNLRILLKQHGISEKYFSIIIQFVKSAEPSMYFM